MAAISITIGSTIWANASGGIAFDFRPSSILSAVIERKSQVGSGYWLLPDGYTKASHNLRLVWTTSDLANLKNSVENASINTGLNTLVIPSKGSFPRCRIASVSEWITFQTAGGNDVTEVTLTIDQFP